MTKKIGVEETRSMIESVIKGREDYEYQYPEIIIKNYETDYEQTTTPDECVYSTPGGNPSCIVGQVFHDFLPESFQKIHDWEYEPNRTEGEMPRIASVDCLTEARENFTDESVDLLRKVQSQQDSGAAWGEVLG